MNNTQKIGSVTPAMVCHSLYFLLFILDTEKPSLNALRLSRNIVIILINSW